jgi:hypothetical protein
MQAGSVRDAWPLFYCKPPVMRCRLIAILLTVLPLASCQFASPKANATFKIGDRLNVTYTTTWQNYTIGLWQKGTSENSTKLGSIVYGEPPCLELHFIYKSY